MKRDLAQEDPALLAMEYERHHVRSGRRLLLAGISAGLFALTVLVAYLSPACGTITKISGTIAWVMFFVGFISMHINSVKERNIFGALLDRALLAPYSLWTAGRAFYKEKEGDAGWMVAVIECNESHIPGDCPLCGAE